MRLGENKINQLFDFRSLFEFLFIGILFHFIYKSIQGKLVFAIKEFVNLFEFIRVDFLIVVFAGCCTSFNIGKEAFLFLLNSLSLHSLTAKVLASISYISAAFLLDIKRPK